MIQGVGAAAMFGAVVLLGLTLGPQTQGLFSRVKTELEFISALSLFGMPQAVFFFVTSRRMSRASALQVTGLLGCLAVAASLLYVGLTHSINALYLAMFAVAAAAMVVHGMLRVLVLAASTRLFNAVTAAPQVVLLLLVIVSVAIGSLVTWQVAAIFLLAFLFGSAFAWQALRANAPHAVDVSTPAAKTKDLTVYGAAAWSVAVLNSAANVLWLRYIESALGLAAVGVFTMGLTFVQVILTPINYAVPLLFKRWVQSPGAASAAARPALASGLVTLLVIAPLLAIQGALPMPSALHAYAGLADLKWTFAAIAVAEVVVRIAAVGANAAGRPWVPALAELMRLVVLTAAVGMGFGMLLPSIATTWACAAAFAACTVLAVVRLRPDSVKGLPR